MPYKNYYKNKVILVTGGAGAIGSRLVAALAGLQAKKIIILDNLSSSYEWNIPDHPNVLFIRGDIRYDDDLRRIFHHRPSVVFHLAAFFANQNSVDYPLLCEEVNGKGILKLLEYSVISASVEKFIYTNSEGGAYGADSPLPHAEKDISFDLSSPYYVSKMAGEAYCRYYHSYYNLPVSILRLFNSYGPGEVPGQYRNVIPNFIYWALKKQALPLTGNENISRDFVFVNDTVEGILRAGFFPAAVGKAINIATGSDTSIYELANMINQKTGNTAGLKILKQRKWDTREKITGNNQLCLDILGFQPQAHLESGIDQTIQWFKDHWSDIENSVEFPPGRNPALDTD